MKVVGISMKEGDDEKEDMNRVENHTKNGVRDL